MNSYTLQHFEQQNAGFFCSAYQLAILDEKLAAELSDLQMLLRSSSSEVQPLQNCLEQDMFTTPLGRDCLDDLAHDTIDAAALAHVETLLPHIVAESICFSGSRILYRCQDGVWRLHDRAAPDESVSALPQILLQVSRYEHISHRQDLPSQPSTWKTSLW